MSNFIVIFVYKLNDNSNMSESVKLYKLSDILNVNGLMNMEVE